MKKFWRELKLAIELEIEYQIIDWLATRPGKKKT